MPVRFARLLAPGLLLAAFAHAEPAHYVVFELDAAGTAQPVYYARVELATAPAAAVVAPPVADADAERIGWRLLRDGATVATDSVDVPLVTTGEFARDPAQGDGTIVPARLPSVRRSFVVRVPVARADALEFDAAGRRQHVVFADVARRAATLALAHTVPHVETPATSTAAGNPANRVDLLILGDGYTAAQSAKFAADAATLHDTFFALTPYQEYASFVNWTTGFVASNQSGADHPPYQAGCTTSACCADVSAQTDPSAGHVADTAFDARYCYGQVQRLLVANNSKVYAAAAAWPNWDKIVVVVNDTVYGGSGGAVPVTSVDPDARQIVLHEYGHSFTHLADEYESPYPGYPACSDAGGSADCEANATDVTASAQVKWRSWFTPGNAIPTPAGSAGVGLFAGARYSPAGMYRAANQCLMRTLGATFCPICRQEYVLSLYRGGFGTPASGIDLIEPGSESPTAGGAVNVAAFAPARFHADMLAPTGGVGVQWLLDGVPVPLATTATYVFRQDALSPATHTLTLRASDLTPFFSAAMADGLLVHERTWTVHVVDDVIFRNGYE